MLKNLKLILMMIFLSQAVISQVDAGLFSRSKKTETTQTEQQEPKKKRSLFSRSKKTETSTTTTTSTQEQKKPGLFTRLKNKVKGTGQAIKETAETAIQNTVDVATQAAESIVADVSETIDSTLDSVLSFGYSNETIQKVDAIFSNEDQISRNKMINASFKQIDDDDMLYFIKQLGELNTEAIEGCSLNLSNNTLTSKGVSMLLDGLKKYPKVVYILDISKNNLGDDGANIVSTKIKNLVSLKHLKLSDNHISGAGALGIIAGLAATDYSSLSSIDFSKNNIGNDHWNLILEQAKRLKPGVLEDGLILKNNKLSLPQGTYMPSNVRVQ